MWKENANKGEKTKRRKSKKEEPPCHPVPMNKRVYLTVGVCISLTGKRP